ncbi:MAG: roadblock/LC7 domain-containing protein, partial [Myxococcota bacterium]
MKRDAIQRVRLHNPHVQMVAVMDATGAVDGSDTLDKWVEAATALVRPFRELAERTSVELGCGGLKTTLIEGQDATLALADVDG